MEKEIKNILYYMMLMKYVYFVKKNFCIKMWENSFFFFFQNKIILFIGVSININITLLSHKFDLELLGIFNNGIAPKTLLL